MSRLRMCYYVITDVINSVVKKLGFLWLSSFRVCIRCYSLSVLKTADLLCPCFLPAIQLPHVTEAAKQMSAIVNAV